MIVLRALFIPLGVAICSHSAIAGGSISYDEVLALTKAEPKLGAEINAELSSKNLPESSIACTSTRLGRQWQKLGGARIGPYSCRIGDRTVEIRTEPVFLDKNGIKLKANEDPQLKASKIDQGSISWEWK